MSDYAAHIEVHIHSRFQPGTDLEKLAAELRPYVEGLMHDLGLPPAELTIRYDGSPPLSSDFSEVWINGTQCRVISSVASTIHDNRELLVDDRFVEATRAQFVAAGPGLSELSRPELLDYVRLMIRACMRVDRPAVPSNVSRSSIQPWTAERCFEDTVRNISNLSCALTYAPSVVKSPAGRDAPVGEMVDRLQYSLFNSLGIRIPRIGIQEDPTLGTGQFRLKINDVRLPVCQGLVDLESLVMASPEEAQVQGRLELDPATLRLVTVATVAKPDRDRLRNAGLEIRKGAGYMMLGCERMLRAHAGCFVVAETVDHELDRLIPYYPDVVAAVRERAGLPAMLRSLVNEGISIKDLYGVIEAMLAVKMTADVDFSQTIVFAPPGAMFAPFSMAERLEDLQPADLAECVRTQLKDYITNRFLGRSALSIYVVGPEVETRIAKAGRDNEKEPLSREEREKLNDAVRSMVGPLDQHWNAVILTDSRRPFRLLIEREWPDIPVLSYDEISPQARIDVKDRLTLPW